MSRKNSILPSHPADILDLDLQTLSTKVRTAMLIYLSLVQICYIARRFGMVKDLLADLRQVLRSGTMETAEGIESINIQKLKTQIQKFKYSLDPAVMQEQEEEIEKKRQDALA